MREVDLRGATMAMTLQALVELTNEHAGTIRSRLVSEEDVQLIFEFTVRDVTTFRMPGRYEMGTFVARSGQVVTWTHDINIRHSEPLSPTLKQRFA